MTGEHSSVANTSIANVINAITKNTGLIVTKATFINAIEPQQVESQVDKQNKQNIKFKSGKIGDPKINVKFKFLAQE